MSTDLEEAKLPIVMKSGLVHWVLPETWQKVGDALASQGAHGFLKITELAGITINTAEVEAAYTMDQFMDMEKLQQGMWQCSWKKWHPKKGVCECREEAYRAEKQRKQDQELAKANLPETPEQYAAGRAAIEKITIGLEAKGIIKKKK